MQEFLQTCFFLSFDLNFESIIIKIGHGVKLTNGVKTMETTSKFGLKDKVRYAFGDFGCNLTFSLISSYLMLFYTQYIGITVAMYSIFIFILKIWDAFNDPMIGIIIDRKRISQESKFKPWIKIGASMLLVGCPVVFLPIKSDSLGFRYALLFISYFVWDIGYTLLNVPYGAMSTAITDVPSERTRFQPGGISALWLPVHL